MDTAILRVDPAAPDPAAIERAARALREGGLVVFPTETVYGFAARADDPRALGTLRAAKGRDGEKPFTLHLASVEDLHRRFGPLPEGAARLAERRLPGPLTLVLPDAAGGFTGIRVPDDAVARAVLEAAGCPVVATSVNAAGEPAAISGAGAAAFATGRAQVLLDAGPSRIGRASTVVRFDGSRVEVLREGAVPAADAIEDAARTLLFVCTGNLCRSPLAEAFAAKAMAERRKIAAAALPGHGRAARSAGTAADRGHPASPGAVEGGRRRGLDLSSHRSRPLTPSLLARAHRVFTVEEAHRATILEFLPEAAGRVRLLDPGGRDIPDPFGRGAAAYAKAAARIEEALARRAESGTLED